MPFYRCTVRGSDDAVMADDVMVSLEMGQGNGAGGWFGSISAEALTSLEAGQRYRLVLEDGRSGEFVVRRNTTAGGANRAIAIVGSGSLA